MYGEPRPYGFDPYRGGPGSPPGYYGGEFFRDCCGPNLLPIVAGILLFVVYALLIPGFAAPYWVKYDSTSEKHYFGIWRLCDDTDTTDSTDAVCTDWVDNSATADWMTATEALMCIGLICLVLATVLLVYWLCSYSRYFFIKCIYILLMFLTFILTLVGVIIFGVNATETPYNNYEFDWCFYLVDVATSVLLFVPILLMCVPSRETFPSYAERMGLKDRFGFDYPNGPPPPRGPRPGYGMAQPVANVYPSSLPMTKPYRNPYPSMPYSNRY